MTNSHIDWNNKDHFHAVDDFMARRSGALISYSNLEQSLCACMAYFGDMSDEAAGIIFYRITNARTMMDVLDKLKKLRIGRRYAVYWHSITKALKLLSETRNQIVHWTSATVLKKEESVGFRVVLRPPNYWSWDEGTPELSSKELEDFSDRCHFLKESVDQLILGAAGVLKGDERDAWLDICQRALAYPNQPEPPQSQKSTKQQRQRPSSRT